MRSLHINPTDPRSVATYFFEQTRALRPGMGRAFVEAILMNSDDIPETLEEVRFPRPNRSLANNVGILTEILDRQERRYRPLQKALGSSRDLADQSAKLRKMMGTFGAALEKEVSSRMMGELQGLRFWQIELEQLAGEIDETSSELHERLCTVKEEKPAHDALLRDMLRYLLNRSTQDADAADLVDRLMQSLQSERGEEHE